MTVPLTKPAPVPFVPIPLASSQVRTIARFLAADRNHEWIARQCDVPLEAVLRVLVEMREAV